MSPSCRRTGRWLGRWFVARQFVQKAGAELDPARQLQRGLNRCRVDFQVVAALDVFHDRFGRNRATFRFLRQQVVAHLSGQARPCDAVPGIRQVPPTRTEPTVITGDVVPTPVDTTVVPHDDTSAVAQVGELGEVDAGLSPSSPPLPVPLQPALPARRLVHGVVDPRDLPTEAPPTGQGDVRVGAICSLRRRRKVEVDRRFFPGERVVVAQFANGPEDNNNQQGRTRDQLVGR